MCYKEPSKPLSQKINCTIDQFPGKSQKPIYDLAGYFTCNLFLARDSYLRNKKG